MSTLAVSTLFILAPTRSESFMRIRFLLLVVFVIAGWPLVSTLFVRAGGFALVCL